MRGFGKILLIFYQILSTLILPILWLIILWRKFKFKESPTRYLERFAISSKQRPQNCQLLWLHAVSVGETNSAWILIDELLKFSSDIKILFTSTSTTSEQVIQQKINSNQFYQNRIIHQFLPVDSYFIVKKFLNYWQPRACIFVESEIWPNFIYCSRQKTILSFLVNARISSESSKKWQKLKKIGFNIFDYFSLIYAQSYLDKNNLSTLTNNNILYEGNLKTQNGKIVVDDLKLQAIKNQIGNRKIWLCSSTHEGEEAIILENHQRLKNIFPDLITIIILRHPSRIHEVIKLISQTNFAVRSQEIPIKDSTEIYIVDTIGELGIFYSLANFVFMGGSLVPVGGHNPIEAMQLNCAIISGQYYFNNFELYENLKNQRGCEIIYNSEQLFEIVKRFLNDPNNQFGVKFLNENAQKYLTHNPNTAKKIVTGLDKILLLKIEHN